MSACAPAKLQAFRLELSISESTVSNKLHRKQGMCSSLDENVASGRGDLAPYFSAH